MIARPVGLAVFNLDGTLLRGETVCEVLAQTLGRLDRMREFETLTLEGEIAAAREEMAAWYQSVPQAELIKLLESATIAPGASEGIGLLRQHGIVAGMASITWEFAVEWFAQLF